MFHRNKAVNAVQKEWLEYYIFVIVIHLILYHAVHSL